MTQSHGYAAFEQNGALQPFAFDRREPGPCDIQVKIRYCGVCHTDLNAIENILGYSSYPLVPGHEMVGEVVSIGAAVTKFKVGDWAGIGTLVDSCRTCAHCEAGLEPYCFEGMTPTYGAPDRQGRMTYGGFANNYVVDERFALTLPKGTDPARAGPLLCAGITTYSPLKRAGIGPGSKVGIIGLGGLGHVAVKWAHAFGAHVAVFSTTPAKAVDARRLGADEAIISTNPEDMARHGGSFDFILDTVSGDHDLNPYLALLAFGGTLCMVGIPARQPEVSPILLATGRRIVTGSMTGGIAETQEMLEFAAQHGIATDVELIAMDQINDALERLAKGDVRYRFVIDMDTLAE